MRQFQNRWFYFHQLAADAARLDGNDVFMSLVPAPFGFGLWTAHFSPTILGVPDGRDAALLGGGRPCG